VRHVGAAKPSAPPQANGLSYLTGLDVIGPVVVVHIDLGVPGRFAVLENCDVESARPAVILRAWDVVGVERPGNDRTRSGPSLCIQIDLLFPAPGGAGEHEGDSGLGHLCGKQPGLCLHRRDEILDFAAAHRRLLCVGRGPGARRAGSGSGVNGSEVSPGIVPAAVFGGRS